MLLGTLSEGQAKWDLETSAGLAVSQTQSQISTSKLTSNVVPLSTFSCCTKALLVCPVVGLIQANRTECTEGKLPLGL